MKRFLLLLVIASGAAPLYAQVLDSTLLHRNIFDLLSDGNRVVLVQPDALRDAVQQHVLRNESKTLQGYRVRIFSSNAQTARRTSLSVKEEFESLFPDVPAYWGFKNLDFRVTVGDFRTKSEAMQFHKELISYPQYRTAVVVSEVILFPAR